MFTIGDGNRHWWILGAASCILGLVVLDETVVGVALPTMRADLHMSQVASHWVVNAYLLTFTCFVAVGGRLGDMLGQRAVFPLGAGLFLIGSFVAGAAPSGGWLIAARALQGIGAAITFPASFAILTATFPPDRRGTAFAVQTTIAGTFMASGPLVGGYFSEVVSWRWIFWINIPVVVATTAILMSTLTPADKGKTLSSALDPATFDYFGLAALVAGLTGITIALMQATAWSWTAPATLGLLVGGLATLVAFVAIELRRDTPLIELDLLRIRTFTGVNIIFAMFQFEKMIVFIFVALYLQHVLGRSPVEAGLVVSVAIVPTLVTSRLAGKLRDRHGARGPVTLTLLATGLAVIAIGLGTVLKSEAVIVAAMIVWGAIMPGIAVPARPALMGAVPATKQGQASGINLSLQMLGGTVAIALCSTLLIVTGSYWLVFLVTGCGTLVSALVAWRTIELPAVEAGPT